MYGKDLIVANEDYTFHSLVNMIKVFSLQVQQDFGFKDKLFGFANEANVNVFGFHEANVESQDTSPASIIYHYFHAHYAHYALYDNSAFVVNGEIVWFGTNLMELLENNQVLQYINS